MEGEQNTQQPNPNPAPNTQQAAPASAPADNTTLMGVLAYLGILVLVPYFTAKENAFVQYHVKQGFVLFAAEIVVWVLGDMVYGLWSILKFVNLGLIILSIFGIVNVVKRKQEEVPLLGQFAKHVPF